jgi:hypothetical protein
MEETMRKTIAAAGLVTVSLLGVGAAGSPVVHATTTDTCPGDDVWRGWVEGKPSRDPGVRVWHDDSGWHVRVTHNRLHERTFSGEIATYGELVDVQAVRLERGDVLSVGPEKHKIVFRFHNYGGIDGIDFDTSCAPALGFGFLADGHRVPPKYIAIGAAHTHPKHNPFVIR